MISVPDPLQCDDPLVKQVMDQRYAIDLIGRGLLPKQISIITGLSGKKVNELRTGLLPVSERRGRPTRSAATLLRKATYRAAASMFISVFRGLCKADLRSGEHWPAFLKSYDIYTALTAGFREDMPAIRIDEAFTLVWSLSSGIITITDCGRHGIRFLALTNQERCWRCPYCTLEDDNQEAPLAGKLGETEPDLGVRAANIDEFMPITMRK